jgi:hypothetical protein
LACPALILSACRGADPAVTVGTLSITDTSADLSISTVATDSVTGALNNAGRIDIDDQFGGAGGSTLSVGGILTNSGQLVIGETNLNSAVQVTAAGLVNTGQIYVSGDATASGTLRVAGTAGFGTAGTLSGSVNLSGGTISFASGTIATILNGSQLQLFGASQIANGGGFNGALAGLATNAGELSIAGDSLAITGDFDNSGRIDIDNQFGGLGGSTLSVGGTLTNTGNLLIGENNLAANDLVTAAALVNTGVISVSGDATAAATLRVAGAAGFGTAGTLSGSANLNGGTIAFASGTISTILTGSQLQLFGASQITNGGGFNSALAGLASNAGELSIADDTLAITGDFTNSNRIDIDNQFGGLGGSTLSVGGTLTNNGQLFIGEGNLSASVSVTAAALVNTGLIDLAGASGTLTATLRVAGAAGFGTAGTLSGSANLNGGTIAFASGTISTILTGSQLQLFGASQITNGGGFNSALAGLASNAGELSIADDSLTITGDFTNSNRIDIDNQFGGLGGSTLSVGGTLTNNGQLFIGEGNLSASVSVTAAALVNTGLIDLAGASGTLTATLRDSGTVVDSGNVDIAANATLSAAGFTQSAGAMQVDGMLSAASVTLTGGSLDGNGTIAGPLDIAGGEVFGGDQIGQPGTLTVTGAYTQGAAGVMIADLAGIGAGQASAIDVTGGASLGGTLDINTVNGFALANGDTFTALTFAPGQLTGAFSALEYNGQVSSGAINIGNGLFMAALYNDAAGNVEIEVTNTITAFTWANPGSGSWTDPANWNPTAIPGAGDAVVVPNLPASATVSLNGSDSIVSLDFEGGGALTVGSGDTLTMTNAISLPGTILGGGVVEIQNQLTNIASIAIQDGTLQLDGGVTGSGTLATAAGGTILLPNGASIGQIEALEATNQGTIAVNGTFSDAGQTLQVTGGTVEFQNTLTNTGSIVIDAGTLKLDAGLAGSNQITLLNGGVLDAGGSTLLLEIGAGNTFTNGGILEASGGGSLQIDGGTLANQGGTLFADGGDIKLTGGVIVVDGTLSSANGGVIHSTAGNTVTLDPVAIPALVNTGVYSVDNGSATVLVGAVSNQGTIADDGSLQIGDAAGDGAVLTNQAGGLIELQQNGVDITQAAAGTNSFINDGTLAQVGGGNDYVEMPLVNNGLVTSKNGFLELQGGVLGGTITAPNGLVALVGTYTSAADTTNNVTFGGAYLGWTTDGPAVLSGPGTLASTGSVNVENFYGYIEEKLTGGITWDNAGVVALAGTILAGTGTLDSATIVNQAGATFDLTTGGSNILTQAGGTYTFINHGTLEQIGGGNNEIDTALTNTALVSADNGNLYLRGPVINSGTLQSDGGYLELADGGTLGGTIQSLGGGGVAIVAGTYAVAAGTVDAVTFGGAYLGWADDGRAVLSGPGTLVSSGSVNVENYFGRIETQLTGGVTWDNAGVIAVAGTILAGAGTLDSATIVNRAGSTIDLTTGGSQMLVTPGGTYNLSNAGTLEQTGGGNDTVQMALANTGLVFTDNGGLYLTGAFSNSGTIESLSNAFLEVAGGGVLGGTFDSAGGNVVVVGTYVAAAGVTDTVLFDGTYLGWTDDGPAVLSGPGTIVSNGSVNVQDYFGRIELRLTDGITLVNAGTIGLNGTLQFGNGTVDSATLVNQAGSVIDLTTGDSRMQTTGTGSYLLTNAGTIEQTGGGNDVITVPVTNTGLITTSNGNLYLEGPVDNSGTIQSNGGFLEVQGGVLGGTYQNLAGNVVLVGTYTLGAGPVDTVALDNVALGWTDDGPAFLTGPGTLVTTGVASVQDYFGRIHTQLGNGIVWDNAGEIDVGGTIGFGLGTADSATLVNLAGATIDLTTGDSRLLVLGGGTYGIVNAGVLEQTGGGTDAITVPLSNSGLITNDNGNLYIQGPISNSGTIQSNGGFIELRGGTLGGTIENLSGGLVLTGTYAVAAGVTDTVDLIGVTLGLNDDGPAVFAGPGTIASDGQVLVQDYFGRIQSRLTGGVTWDNAGVIQADGTISFGQGALDSATLVNQASGVINLDTGDSQIVDLGSGVYTLVNAGLLEKTSGGTTQVEATVVDTGTITVTQGGLAFDAGGTFSGPVSGAGAVAFNGGNVTLTAGASITTAGVAVNAGTLTIQGGTIASASLSIGGGVEITGYGAIGDLSNNGVIDAAGGLLTVDGGLTGSGSLQIETGSTLELTGAVGQAVTFNGIDATLLQDPSAAFTGALENFGAGDTIDLGGVTLSAASIGNNQLIGTLAAGGTIAFSAPGIDAGLKLVLGSDASGASTISLLPSAVSAVPTIISALGPNNGIALPQVHVGASDQRTLTIANTATAPADGLTVGIGATTGDADGSGSITSLAPGGSSSAITVGVNDSSAGAKSGTVSLVYDSDGSVSGVAASLGSQTLNVSGSVYRYAAPSVTAPTGVILHVGDGGGSVTEALTVANTAAADGFSEGLDAAANGVVSGNLTGVSGNAGDIAAGGSGTLAVTFSTASAGVINGSVNVALTSDGTGVDTLGLTPLGSAGAGYSAEGEFSVASNANGVWSYLAGGTLLSTSGSGSNFARWDNNSSIPTSASVTQNTTSTTQTYSNTIQLPPSELNLDPESLANVGVVFTAPDAGVYTFSGAFAGTDVNEQSHTVAVVVNGSTVESGTIGSFGQSVAIGLTETLAAGAVVAFDSNTGASFSNLSTGLALTVASNGSAVVPVGATIDNYATAAIQQVSGPATLVRTGNTYTLDLGTVAAGPGSVAEALAVANTAGGPADWLSGLLSASGSSAFSDTGLGSFGTLGAGGTTPLSIQLSTANAGVFTQTITLAATDSNAAGFNEVLAGQTLVVTGTVLSTAQLAQATINEPTPIVLPDVHVAPLVENDQTTVSISNTGSAALSGAVLSATGDAYGAGAFSGLGVGLTNTTSIVAGLNNTSAGAKSGTVTLGFSSGSAPPVPLPSGSVSLTGDVYREAAPSVAAPANIYVHVGDGGGSGTSALVAVNTDPADGFSEALDASIVKVVSGGLTGASGSTGEIAAGATNASALSLRFSTATATTINATVAVKETSDGTGIDTLGLTQLGTVDVPVTVTVDNFATAAIAQQGGSGTLVQTGSVYTLNLGTFSAGQDPLTADFDLENTASGPSDTLSGVLSLVNGSTAFSDTGLGAFTNGAPFQVTLATGSVGSFAETIVFAGTGSNPSGFSQVLPNETLVVTGAVDASAVPVINTASPIDFGNVRQGATEQQAVSITNAAPAGSAFLDVFTGGASGAGTDGGAILLLAPGATDDTSLLAGLDTSQAGVQSGQAFLNIQSDTGSGGTQHFLESGTIGVQGTVYREAAPSLASSRIVYLHAGESTNGHLVAQNTDAADGFSEKLVASVVGVDGALIGGGGSVTVAAGGSNATGLSVAINAGSTAGVFTGNAVVDTRTDGSGIDGLGILDLGTVDVAVTYDVNNFATAELAQTGGNGLMTPTGIANTYTLNLGSTEQNAAALTASLEALNAAQGPASDLLSGAFNLSGDSEFSNSGFGAFSGLTFGTADTNPDVVLNTGTIGTFSETIVLTPTGSNPSGYSGVLSNETIVVVGTILPEPPPAPPPLPTAIAWGDVHLTTFDGLYYNFQAEGEFVLAQSTTGESFQVQARMQPYGANSTVSVITMLAAEVGSDRVTIAIGRNDAVSINNVGVVFGAVGETMALSGGGSITEVSAGTYQINWGTGEEMTASVAGTYINTSLTLSAADGPGSVQGLLGGDTGQGNDFQLADGTVLAQPMDSATLYGAFADAWRVTGGNSLMDYLAGQTTGTFTDKNFPADSVNIDNLPAAILQAAEQEVLQAGITDPNQQAAAIVDLLVTGDPNALLADANINQTGVVTDAAIINTPPAPVPALGVSAAATNVVETAGGTTTVTFTAYMTAATGTDTVIDYAVTAPDATYLSASSFGGTLPSGFVVIAAGQTTANFTVTLPTAVLGATPSSNLQVTISSTNGDPVFGRSAQTEIDNFVPVAGNPAILLVNQLSGPGTFGGSNGHYTLNLGTLVAGESPLQAHLQIGNEALAPADFLTGTIVAGASNGFTVYGTGEVAPLSAGSSYQGLAIQTNSGQVGSQSETIVFSPVDENITGYSSILPAQTIVVTDTVLSAAVGTVTTPGPINLGTFYQGDIASTALDIGNTAAAGSAGLDVSVSVASGAATAAGAITDLAPGAASASGVSVGIDTSSPGVKTGIVTVNYASDAGNGNTAADGSTQVQVTGTVFGPATAFLSAAPIFVHVGDDGGSASTTITVSNTAPDNGFAENLQAQVVGFGPFVTAASGSTEVDPGKSNSAALTATLSTAALGTYSGFVGVALQSNGTGIDSHGITSLGTVDVPVTINVDQFAVAAIEEISGNGTLTPSGVASQYVLNLGTVAQFATPMGANLGVLNDVLGQSDLLAGSFSIAGAPQFVNAGFGAFGSGTEIAGLAAQGVDGSPVVVLSTGTVGTFTETITLTPTGYNAGGYSAALTPETVTITGTVVAAPPPVPVNRVADAWGDVHLTTFDGLYYNFQAEGEFVLSESTVAGDTFAVQARMQPLGSSSVTLNTEIAAQIGNDRVTFEAGRANTVFIDGVASSLSSLNAVVTLAGGVLEENSANSYTLVWNTGEQLQVTDEGTYLNATVSLPNSDAGKVQGLLGNDDGNPSNDLMLPGGTVLPQPTTYSELYGQYADAWRVTDPTSLMDYGPGQDTASFTNTNFPYNQVSLGNLPPDAVAQAEAAAAAAGITDPNLVLAAVEDYLLTGNPNALIGSENVQQQEGGKSTTGTTPTAPPPVVAAVGVFANLPSVVESTTGANSVGFTVSLTSAEANATTVDYQVVDSGPGFLSAADFGGILPSGTVTIAAGQTSALFTVALPANVLGSAADENLQVVISSTGGEAVFAPLAQTEILATGPTAGNPAAPLVEQLSGDGTLAATGASTYVLNLGTVEQYADPLVAGLGVLNNGLVPADLLSGSFVVNGSTLYENSGLTPFSPLAAGAADTAPELELLTGQIGTFTETITLSPTDSNLTGFSASLAPVTVVVTGTVAPPPPPPPPPVPVATAWGDVHLTTFDGLYYNFQAAGEFILTKSTVAGDMFQVQGRLQPYGTGSTVSVLTQLGAEIGTDDVTFGVGRSSPVYLDGTAYTFNSSGVMTLAGGTVTQIADGDYRVNWATGESMTVTVGTYINDTISLTSADANKVEGLLGPDSGNPSADLQLANGTVIPQPVTSTELYGAYANSWRITDPTSLLNYGSGQTTATFTDTSFPADVLQLDQLPASVVAAAELIAEQAGITDPNLIQAAAIDLLVTGNPNAVFASANVQQQGVNLFGAGVSSAPPLPEVGIVANNKTAVETTSGSVAVGYTVYLTAAEAQATTITYQVTDPGAGFLGLSGIVGGTGSGSVQIAAGQTSAQITVDVLANALGSQPDANLQVTIAPTGGEGVIGTTAQTEIINPVPTAGNPASALVEQLSGDGSLTGSGTSYHLNLGTAQQNASPLFANLGIENSAVVPADNLSGLFTISDFSEFLNTGFDPFSGIAPGSADTEPVISLNTGTIGVFTETVVLQPTDTNPSGYSQVENDVTVTVTGTIVAPPPPPPPPVPTAIAWGDVHLTTFDGLYYNFQAEGEFTLAKSTVAGDGFDVQIRTEPYGAGSSVSVIDQIAAGLGNQSVTFGLNRADTVYLNGTAQAMGVGSVLTINGDTVRELSSTSYLVTWSTGETMTVTSGGTYLNVSASLSSSDGPGSVQGLLGANEGIAKDFQLANGTVLAQPITTAQLYGAFADAWRLTQSASLLNYAPGQTTSSFTDLAFPSDAVTLADLPANLRQEGLQAAIQAGITDPNLQQAAALDFIVTGIPDIVVGGQNVQQQGVTTTAATVTPSAVTTAVGVSANSAALVEPGTGNLSVGFTVYLTAAEAQATTVDYTVAAPGAGYLDATAFGGTLPSGSVTIAAGQTSASFSVSVASDVLGSLPSSALQVGIAPEGGEAVFAPNAQTTIVNNVVEPGTPASPAFALLGGVGTLTQNGNAYTLNLGTIAAGTSIEALSLALENIVGAGGSSLAGSLSATSTPGFSIAGTGPLPSIAAGSLYEDLHVAVNTSAGGTNTETITLTPLSQNASGYTGTLAPVTLTITDVVTQQNFVLTRTPTTISGGTGGDAIFATNGVLYGGDHITPAGSGNTLFLDGPGVFDLRAPVALSNIQAADVEDAAAGQGQVIYLRNGLDLTLNVLDGAGITVVGAANNDIINLGSGNAAVYLGGATETVNGGSGGDTFVGTAATIGETVLGGSGTNVLKIQGGGTVTMGGNITGMQSVLLDNAASYDFTANATAGLVIHAGTGNDTIVAGAGSQAVFGSTGTLTVLETAGQAAAVYGVAGTATTLAITTGGTVALNGGDRNLAVRLAAADTLVLPFNASIAVQGGGGDDALIATSGVLRAGQTIAPGGTTNTLLLQGAGAFDLRAPATLSNIQTAAVENASAGQGQVIYLRTGLDLTLDVLDAAAITVVGAANNDIVNLGSGNAVVYLGGVGETVNGGSGNATFVGSAATIGGTIAAGSGTNYLKVQGGGSATMGTGITGVQSVLLDDAASYDFTANATAGLVIHAGTGSDTIVAGAGSQAVFGSTGTLAVQATAARSGVAVYGTGGTTSLDITTGGTVTLNGGDRNLTVQLAAADTMVLSPNTSIAVRGGGGDDTLIATNGVLRAGQTIAPGGGTNTLLLQGAGFFNLAAPTVLSNIQTVDVADAPAGQGHVVTLRAGLDLTVDVLDAGAITVFGAANNDIINLGSGNAVVYLGVGESVNGGTGNGTFFVTAATADAAIDGGSGTNVLHVQGGGSVTMGTGITGMSQVFLDNSATYDFTANATTRLSMFAGTGTDTITVGAAAQKVVGSTGALTVKATAAEAGIVIDSGTGSATLELTTGGTAKLNVNDTNLTVKLDASTNLGLGGLGFITAIGAAAGHDTITAGGANQTLESTGGNDTLVGSAAFGDTFLGTSAGLAGDLIKGFGGSDAIDITDMVSGSVKPYVFNTATGQLTVTDGSHSVTLAFSGSYTAGNFAAPVSDGHNGTLITFVK